MTAAIIITGVWLMGASPVVTDVGTLPRNQPRIEHAAPFGADVIVETLDWQTRRRTFFVIDPRMRTAVPAKAPGPGEIVAAGSVGPSPVMVVRQAKSLTCFVRKDGRWVAERIRSRDRGARTELPDRER